MNIVLKLSNKHNKFMKSFIKWYTQQYNDKLNVNTFITLPSIYQLSIIYKYIRFKYKLGISYDEWAVVIYYLNPEDNTDYIMDNYINTKKFNNIAYAEYELEELNMVDAFERAIITLLNNLH